jgi:GntR family transcriptional regulator/MocR family aminotransferase
MGRKEAFQDLCIRPRSPETDRSEWLYQELRTAILEGRLPPGARIPSSRSLARQYRVARGTVVYAFGQLRVEGYLESRVGSGSYVASNLPDNYFKAGITTAGPGGVTHLMRMALSRQARKTLACGPLPTFARQKGNVFRPYEPALDAFPTALWARLSGRRMRQASARALAEGDVRGYKPLRTAVAAYLGAFRGVRCVED